MRDLYSAYHAESKEGDVFEVPRVEIDFAILICFKTLRIEGSDLPNMNPKSDDTNVQQESSDAEDLRRENKS